MAIGVQIIVLSYNHFSGYNPIESPTHFLVSLLFGSLLSIIAGFLIAIPDLLIIGFLNHYFSWNTKVLNRIIIQICLSILLAVFISTLISLFSNFIRPYSDGLINVLISNALIFSLVNIIMMVILEAWLFFMESKQAKLKAEDLEKELSQIRFEILKSQINPHFMFNSLNVLSGLIEKDVSKAQVFIDEFSTIYRYVLETIEKPVVSLNDELGFVRSYIYLQKMRYGEFLTISINLPANLLSMLLPPLSLQLVMENAIKHNSINQSQPLCIDIYGDKDGLIVKNNIQSKISSYASTGLGQNNLIKRYAMISESIPRFTIESNHYIAKLPLIKND